MKTLLFLLYKTKYETNSNDDWRDARCQVARETREGNQRKSYTRSGFERTWLAA